MPRLSLQNRSLDPYTLRWAAGEHAKAATEWEGVAARIWEEMQPLFASDPKLKVEMLRYEMLRNRAGNDARRAKRYRALATRIENERAREW